MGMELVDALKKQPEGFHGVGGLLLMSSLAWRSAECALNACLEIRGVCAEFLRCL